jgi:proteic killer suppression protein
MRRDERPPEPGWRRSVVRYDQRLASAYEEVPRGKRRTVAVDKRQLSLHSKKMIASFKHRGLKRLYERGDRSRVPAEFCEKLEHILFALDNALVVDALDLPGFRLHALRGDLKGCWSVTVRANWRVIFRFKDGQASDVDLVDYH